MNPRVASIEIQRLQVAHVIPDATTIIVDPPSQAAFPDPTPAQPSTVASVQPASSEALARQLYGISRAKYYRWNKDGQSVAEGPDPPPWSDPPAMVTWYARMKGRGIFKHKCPDELLSASTSHKAAEKTPPTAIPSSASLPSHLVVNGRAAPGARGFLVEHEKLEAHTALLREDYLAAYERGDTDQGDTLKERYFEAFELLRKSAAQKGPITLSEGSQVKVADIQEELAQIIPNTVKTLTSEDMSRKLYTELNLAVLGIPFAPFHEARVRHTITVFDSLVKSRFAPPMLLAA